MTLLRQSRSRTHTLATLVLKLVRSWTIRPLESHHDIATSSSHLTRFHEPVCPVSTHLPAKAKSLRRQRRIILRSNVLPVEDQRQDTIFPDRHAMPPFPIRDIDPNRQNACSNSKTNGKQKPFQPHLHTRFRLPRKPIHHIQRRVVRAVAGIPSCSAAVLEPKPISHSIRHGIEEFRNIGMGRTAFCFHQRSQNGINAYMREIRLTFQLAKLAVLAVLEAVKSFVRLAIPIENIVIHNHGDRFDELGWLPVDALFRPRHILKRIFLVREIEEL